MNQMNQTKQILAHLSGQVGTLPAEQVSQWRPLTGPTMLVLFAGNPIGLDETLQDLDTLRQSGWCFDVAFSANSEALMNADKIVQRLKPRQIIGRDMNQLKLYNMGHLKCVIAPMITHNTARKLVMGIQDGLIPNLLWQALWDSIPVYMDMESLRTYHGRPTLNPHLNLLMEETIAQLMKLGVKNMARPSELMGTGLRENNVDKPDTMPGSGCNGMEMKKVITEKDIIALSQHEKALNIYQGTIVTPLARDTAVARGVKLHWK